MPPLFSRIFTLNVMWFFDNLSTSDLSFFIWEENWGMNKKLIRKRGIAALVAAMIMSTSTGCSISDLPLQGPDESKLISRGSEGSSVMDISKFMDPFSTKKNYDSDSDTKGNGSAPMTNPFSFDNDNDSSSEYEPDDYDPYEYEDPYEYDDYDDEDDDGFTIGHFRGEAYVNEYFGLKIKTPSGYTYCSDKELEEESGYPMEYHNDDRLAKQALTEGEAMIVAYASDSTGINFFEVAIQESEEIAESIFDEEDILNIAKITLQKNLQDAGGEIVSIDVEQKIVADEVHYVLTLHGTYEGYDFYEQMVNIQKGNYMLSVISNSFISDMSDDILDSIEKIY